MTKDRLMLMAERDTAVARAERLHDLLREARARLAHHEPPLTHRVIDLIRGGAGSLMEYAATEADGRELMAAADALELWLRVEAAAASGDDARAARRAGGEGRDE